MAISHMMLGTDTSSCTRKMLMQYPSTHGSQILTRGVHWKAAANTPAMFQHVESPPNTYAQVRTDLIGNIRK